MPVHWRLCFLPALIAGAALPAKAAAPDIPPLRAVVRQFQIQGNTVFPSATLAATLRGFLERPLTVEEIYAAADCVAAYYHAHGYVLATVALPVQPLDSGILLLQVREGRIGALRIEGNRRYDAARLRRWLTPVAPGAVYRRSDLESGLMALNALPGLSARAVLEPAGDPDVSNIVVHVQETAAAGILGADNYGRRRLGRYRATAAAELDNPLRVGDQLSVTALHTDGNRLGYGELGYRLPLRARGPELALSYGRALFSVPGNGGGWDRIGRAELRWPLLRTAADLASLAAGGADVRANANLAGDATDATDVRLAVLRAEFRHEGDDGARSRVTLEARSNFTRARSAPDAHAEALRLELDAARSRPLPAIRAGFELYARLDGVYSPDPLPGAEQFAAGGSESVRAYPPVEARGDRGLAATLGIRQLLREGIVVRAYLDGAQVRALQTSLPARTTLLGAGFGCDVGYQGWSSRLDFALPLGDGGHSRVLASLAARF